MKEYEEIMKKYEGITLPIYGPWDLKKQEERSEFFKPQGLYRGREFGIFVPGPRERLGIFSKSSGHFFERPFLECDVIKGGGLGWVRKIPVGGGLGENNDMKRVNFKLLYRPL